GGSIEAGRDDSARSGESVLTAPERLPQPPSTVAAIRTRRTRRTESPPVEWPAQMGEAEIFGYRALSIPRLYLGIRSVPDRIRATARGAAEFFSARIVTARLLAYVSRARFSRASSDPPRDCPSEGM